MLKPDTATTACALARPVSLAMPARPTPGAVVAMSSGGRSAVAVALGLLAHGLPLATQAQPTALTAAPQTVVITATLSPEDTRTAPASTTVVTRDELERRHAFDLLDAVRATPGVTLSPRQVGGRKTFSLRGLEGKHTLVLVDGRRVSPSDDVIGHSDYQYGWLPTSAIERVEIVRGPMSALYGSEAIGGVVNIITRRAANRWLGSATLHAGALTGGGGEQGSVALFGTGPVAPGLRLRLNAASSRVEPVADASDPRYSELEGRENTSLALGVEWQPAAGHTLSADAFANREERERDNVATVRTPPPPREVPYIDYYDIERSQLAVGWRWEQGPWRSQLRAYRSELDVQSRRTQGVAPTRPQNLQDEIVDGHVARSFGEHRVTLGAEHRVETLTNAGLAGGQDDATHRAVFGQGEFRLAEGLDLTAGVHVDRHEFFGTEASPRLYLVWESGPWVLKGGYGHAFKAPTLKQISPSYVGAEGPHTFLGNANVKPETSDSVELGLSWAGAGTELSATVFDNRVRDLIVARQIAVNGPRRTYRYDNVERARLRGLELGASARLDAAWSTAVDATWLRTRDAATGQPLLDRPRVTLAARLQWQGQAALAPLSAHLRVEHTGGQTTGGNVALPAYTLVHAGLGWRASRQLTLRAGVDNLGDLRLAEQSPAFGYAERGRTAYLRLTVEL
jgi:outer membrane receptor for ferrienterochelin and colicins